MKKRIIFITEALWIGGIETALINLLNRINYSRYEVTLLVCRAELNLKERIPKECRILIVDRDKTYSSQRKYIFSKLYHLTEKPENPSKLHKALMWMVPMIKWIENRLFIDYVKKAMKYEKYDTAIIYSDRTSEIALRAIKADKYLMFYHHGIMRHVYHDQIAYKRCEKIITVSKNQAKELSKFVPIAKDKIIVINNLIDIGEIRKKAAETTLELFDKTKFNIVSVGRVSYEKGMDIAVRACAKLAESGFCRICWWIVGDGPAMQEVRKSVAQAGMEKYIILVGMKKNPYPYIRQADLYVQPSRFEGYPMTLLEALVIGQPVISTDNSGAREILQEGETGLLCSVDADQLADTVKMVLENKKVLVKLRDNVNLLDFEKQNEVELKKFENLL